MSVPVGLITGSEPFAGLPSNPAQLVLPHLDGQEIEGHRIVAVATPASLGRLPSLLPELVATHRPAFVLALGLALGANVVRVEKYALNATDFGVADNEGVRPAPGTKLDPDGPDGRAATWDAAAVVEAILELGVPATASYNAGTHLCNFTLYTYLAALEAAGSRTPCGFLHLPYLPEQIVWMIRQRGGAAQIAPLAPLDLPSMSFDTQLAAVRAATAAIARQAATTGADTP